MEGSNDYNSYESTTSLETYTENGTDVPTLPEQAHFEYSILYFLSAFAMLTIIIGSLLGNLLVIVSVIRHRKLLIVTNYFVVSLAVSDILVTAGAMTFNASVQLTGRWLFNSFLCDLWNSFDVYFSTVSILNLMFISVDRYCAIMMPFEYLNIMTNLTSACMLVFIWLSPAFISFFPIFLGWYTTNEHLEYLLQNPDICVFRVNKVYAIVSSAFSFYLPCPVMAYVYFSIFKMARWHEQKMLEQRGHSFRINRQRSRSVGDDLGRSAGSSHELTAHEAERGDGNKTQTKERSIFKFKREHKAATTLGITMGGFVLCWLPFFLWYPITAICGDGCPCPDIVVAFLFWIGYFNSALNPIIYACFNRDFRAAFQETLKFVFCRFCRGQSSDSAKRNIFRPNFLQRNDCLNIYPKAFLKHIDRRRRSSV